MRLLQSVETGSCCGPMCADRSDVPCQNHTVRMQDCRRPKARKLRNQITSEPQLTYMTHFLMIGSSSEQGLSICKGRIFNLPNIGWQGYERGTKISAKCVAAQLVVYVGWGRFQPRSSLTGAEHICRPSGRVSYSI